MHDDDKPTPSISQDGWISLAATIREAIRQQFAFAAAMKPDEIGALIRAADEALRFEQRAALFDHYVSLEESRNRPPDERTAISGW